MEHFDLVVIGSGPAGFAAAMRAVDFQKDVCIIEKKHIGGAGIMHGALTSKTMWALSHDFSVAASVDRGFRASGLIVDYKQVRKTVLQAAKEKQYQILSQIETFARGRYNKGKGSVALKYGAARFIDKDTIEIDNNGEKTIIKGDSFVIATGSRPRPYPGIPVDQERIINSDGILNLTEFPERMMIIGSGIIGCEFATIFSNFKQTQVHILDRSNRVIPFEDDDVSDFVSNNLERNGVIVHHTASLRTIRNTGNSLQIVLDYSDGHSQVIEVDVALIAIGRMGNTQNLGLENLGVYPDENGFLSVDKNCRVVGTPPDSKIYAAGDITGSVQLYSIAEMQGRFTAKAITDNIQYPLNYSNMSTLMFFRPEVAAVGMNEKMLQQRKIPYRSAYYTNDLVNRAIAMRNTNGFIKIMISDDDQEERILGMRAAGPQASAFIVSVAHLINLGKGLKEVMQVAHPHPSVTEGIQECLRVFESKAVFKQEAFPQYIKIKSWRPSKPVE